MKSSVLRLAARRVCVLLLGLAVLALSACEGCKGSQGPATPTGDAATEAPTARLYLLSDLAGALEPCGCVKDQLGGMDHFGALVRGGKSAAFATLAAGPTFFMDMELEPEKRAQEAQKAETIASTLKTLRLHAFAPSRNEWAAGPEAFQKIRDVSGAAVLAANLTGVPVAKTSELPLGTVKLGVIGVAAPEKAKAKLEGVASSDAIAAVKAAAADLKARGVHAMIVLASVGRGEAKRIADENPELLAIVVGSTGANGDKNTEAAPPEQIGDVLLVETGNHLQSVGVLDLYLRDGAKGPHVPVGTGQAGQVKFADGTGIERMRKRADLARRVAELRAKIATWETDKSVDPKDVAARKQDVARLEAERDALDAPVPPKNGSFYRFAMKDVREDLGADDAVKTQMLAYYKQVNDANKVAFKDKKPPPVPKGQAAYIGVEACTNCHEAPRKVWDATGHAHAYPTLEKQFKEANLDCVGCHVTGYDKPGGSTVTHVSELKNVQCEVCHGPGSLHAAKPEKVAIPVAKPAPDMCLSCHHPPHVHTFDANAKMADILGPGHGR
jgi:2',3'-cyclic-nucleotide 2'-phosphodiesterase (5'-nucleotidase family)